MNTDWIISGATCVDRRLHEYTIVTSARDVQTSEIIVVYRQNFGEFETLCCPLDAFLLSFSSADKVETKGFVAKAQKPLSGQERMMLFFDTDSFDEKARILKELHILGELTDGIIDNLAATMDVVIEQGDLESRYDQLKFCVETRARFENTRLR